jgi:hypothetical protein
MLTSKEQRLRVWGIVAVILGIHGIIAIPLPILAFFSIPVSVLCGGIVFHRGAERLGGTAIALGAIGFLFHVFLIVSYFLSKLMLRITG